MVFDLSLVSVASGIFIAGDAVVKARSRLGGTWSAMEDEVFQRPESARDLVVSEIMYHPVDPTAEESLMGFDDDDFFEFIELRNVGAGNVLLDSLRFTKGVDVALSGLIPAGGFALVVANRAAFEMRYGSGFHIVGEWEVNDRLDNGGELIRLRGIDDQVLLEFSYGDRAPWVSSPDGGGQSLILRNSLAQAEPSLASNWRASTEAGGNPGSSDSTVFIGETNKELLEYAVAGEPRISGDGEFSIRINILSDDLIGEIQSSSDLKNWSPVSDQMELRNVESGEADLVFLARQLEPEIFYRYRVEKR